MLISLNRHKSTLFSKSVCVAIICSFVLSLMIPPRYSEAQTVAGLPQPGVMIPLTNPIVPTVIRGIKIYPDNPLKFDFIINDGNEHLNVEDFREASQRLIKYFMASLTVQESDMWVNLSPYEQNRIVPESFGQTEMGRDLLAQDYILKQLTASLMYPEKDLGHEFWQRIHEKVNESNLLENEGNKEVELSSMLRKVWIVPDKAVVFEQQDMAFVIESHLKVMLEDDKQANEYERSSEPIAQSGKTNNENQVIQAEILREMIIPEIEREVNQGENFKMLRQIYQSMILATWFKRKLRESIIQNGNVPFLQEKYIDQNKISGVNTDDPTINGKIYEQYVEAFKQGVYNYIKEDYDPVSQEIIPRKYFSGGTHLEVDQLLESKQLEEFNAKDFASLFSPEGEDRTVTALLEPTIDRAGFIEADQIELLKVFVREMRMEFISALTAMISDRDQFESGNINLETFEQSLDANSSKIISLIRSKVISPSDKEYPAVFSFLTPLRFGHMSTEEDKNIYPFVDAITMSAVISMEAQEISRIKQISEKSLDRLSSALQELNKIVGFLDWILNVDLIPTIDIQYSSDQLIRSVDPRPFMAKYISDILLSSDVFRKALQDNRTAVIKGVIDRLGNLYVGDLDEIRKQISDIDSGLASNEFYLVSFQYGGRRKRILSFTLSNSSGKEVGDESLMDVLTSAVKLVNLSLPEKRRQIFDENSPQDDGNLDDAELSPEFRKSTRVIISAEKRLENQQVNQRIKDVLGREIKFSTNISTQKALDTVLSFKEFSEDEQEQVLQFFRIVRQLKKSIEIHNLLIEFVTGVMDGEYPSDFFDLKFLSSIFEKFKLELVRKIFRMMNGLDAIGVMNLRKPEDRRQFILLMRNIENSSSEGMQELKLDSLLKSIQDVEKGDLDVSMMKLSFLAVLNSYETPSHSFSVLVDLQREGILDMERDEKEIPIMLQRLNPSGGAQTWTRSVSGVIIKRIKSPENLEIIDSDLQNGIINAEEADRQRNSLLPIEALPLSLINQMLTFRFEFITEFMDFMIQLQSLGWPLLSDENDLSIVMFMQRFINKNSSRPIKALSQISQLIKETENMEIGDAKQLLNPAFLDIDLMYKAFYVNDYDGVIQAYMTTLSLIKNGTIKNESSSIRASLQNRLMNEITTDLMNKFKSLFQEVTFSKNMIWAAFQIEEDHRVLLVNIMTGEIIEIPITQKGSVTVGFRSDNTVVSLRDSREGTEGIEQRYPIRGFVFYNLMVKKVNELLSRSLTLDSVSRRNFVQFVNISNISDLPKRFDLLANTLVEEIIRTQTSDSDRLEMLGMLQLLDVEKAEDLIRAYDIAFDPNENYWWKAMPLRVTVKIPAEFRTESKGLAEVDVFGRTIGEILPQLNGISEKITNTEGGLSDNYEILMDFVPISDKSNWKNVPISANSIFILVNKPNQVNASSSVDSASMVDIQSEFNQLQQILAQREQLLITEENRAHQLEGEKTDQELFDDIFTGIQQLLSKRDEIVSFILDSKLSKSEQVKRLKILRESFDTKRWNEEGNIFNLSEHPELTDSLAVLYRRLKEESGFSITHEIGSGQLAYENKFQQELFRVLYFMVDHLIRLTQQDSEALTVDLLEEKIRVILDLYFVELASLLSLVKSTDYTNDMNRLQDLLDQLNDDSEGGSGYPLVVKATSLRTIATGAVTLSPVYNVGYQRLQDRQRLLTPQLLVEDAIMNVMVNANHVLYQMSTHKDEETKQDIRTSINSIDYYMMLHGLVVLMNKYDEFIQTQRGRKLDAEEFSLKRRILDAIVLTLGMDPEVFVDQNGRAILEHIFAYSGVKGENEFIDFYWQLLSKLAPSIKKDAMSIAPEDLSYSLLQLYYLYPHWLLRSMAFSVFNVGNTEGIVVGGEYGKDNIRPVLSSITFESLMRSVTEDGENFDQGERDFWLEENSGIISVDIVRPNGSERQMRLGVFSFNEDDQQLFEIMMGHLLQVSDVTYADNAQLTTLENLKSSRIGSFVSLKHSDSSEAIGLLVASQVVHDTNDNYIVKATIHSINGKRDYDQRMVILIFPPENTQLSHFLESSGMQMETEDSHPVLMVDWNLAVNDEDFRESINSQSDNSLDRAEILLTDKGHGNFVPVPVKDIIIGNDPSNLFDASFDAASFTDEEAQSVGLPNASFLPRVEQVQGDQKYTILTRSGETIALFLGAGHILINGQKITSDDLLKKYADQWAWVDKVITATAQLNFKDKPGNLANFQQQWAIIKLKFEVFSTYGFSDFLSIPTEFNQESNGGVGIIPLLEQMMSKKIANPELFDDIHSLLRIPVDFKINDVLVNALIVTEKGEIIFAKQGQESAPATITIALFDQVEQLPDEFFRYISRIMARAIQVDAQLNGKFIGIWDRIYNVWKSKKVELPSRNFRKLIGSYQDVQSMYQALANSLNQWQRTLTSWDADEDRDIAVEIQFLQKFRNGQSNVRVGRTSFRELITEGVISYVQNQLAPSLGKFSNENPIEPGSKFTLIYDDITSPRIEIIIHSPQENITEDYIFPGGLTVNDNFPGDPILEDGSEPFNIDLDNASLFENLQKGIRSALENSSEGVVSRRDFLTLLAGGTAAALATIPIASYADGQSSGTLTNDARIADQPDFTTQEILDLLINSYERYYDLITKFADRFEKIAHTKQDADQLLKQTQDAINSIDVIPQLRHLRDKPRSYREELKKILKDAGYNYSWTEQGVNYRGKSFGRMPVMVIRPILSEKKVERTLGDERVSYQRVELGRNLITLPNYLLAPAESANEEAVSLFVEDYVDFAKQEFKVYQRHKSDSTAPNLSRMSIKRWASELNQTEAEYIAARTKALAEENETHGSQHVLDLKNDRKNGIERNSARSAELEARAYLRVILEQVAVFPALEYINAYEQMYQRGVKGSDYAVAGHKLYDLIAREAYEDAEIREKIIVNNTSQSSRSVFEGLFRLNHNIFWDQNIEDILDSNDFYRLILRVIYKNPEYRDMLASYQISEAEQIVGGTDRAEISDSPENDSVSESPVGGINFDPAQLIIESQGDGVQFNLPENLRYLENVQIDGFKPVIFQIVPTNLPLLLGFGNKSSAPLADRLPDSEFPNHAALIANDRLSYLFN